MQFEGFLKLYEEGRDERLHAAKGKDDTDRGRRPRAAGFPRSPRATSVTDRSIETEQHFTQPPPRYSEATLVKKMEELGIGRPSTYASTLAVLQERDYVRIEKKRLIPEDKGRLVIAFLEGFFKRYVEYDFTADLEEKLDLISDDKLEWKDVLRDFWRDFTGAVEEIKDLRVGDVLGSAQRAPRAAHLPPARGRRRPAHLPIVQDRASQPEDLQQVRRLHRLRELSRVPLHAPARRPGRRSRRRRARRQAAWATIPTPGLR